MKAIKSDMAGTLLELKVTAGQKVKSGDELAVMESMKMEVPIVSPANGEISTIHKKAGDFVNAGETILEIK